MMWVFSVSDDQHVPEVRGGYVRAASLTDAFALIKDDRTNLYPLPNDFDWPAHGRDLIEHGELGLSKD